MRNQVLLKGASDLEELRLVVARRGVNRIATPATEVVDVDEGGLAELADVGDGEGTHTDFGKEDISEVLDGTGGQEHVAEGLIVEAQRSELKVGCALGVVAAPMWAALRGSASTGWRVRSLEGTVVSTGGCLRGCTAAQYFHR